MLLQMLAQVSDAAHVNDVGNRLGVLAAVAADVQQVNEEGVKDLLDAIALMEHYRWYLHDREHEYEVRTQLIRRENDIVVADNERRKLAKEALRVRVEERRAEAAKQRRPREPPILLNCRRHEP